MDTKLIHADDDITRVSDVVQPINVATTFRYNADPEKLVKYQDLPENSIIGNPVYSRLSHPNSENCEAVLSEILNGHVVCYSSGLAAFMAALSYFNPKVLAIGDGYHGCHGVANLFTRWNGLKQISLVDSFDELQKGDVVHLETPVNPTGLALDIQEYADKAHEKGAFLLVDATFAPPPLQDPFLFGADMVMHSATKYFGGHSDLLAGCLVTKNLAVKTKLVEDRVFLGTNIANLESFLLRRSLRTYGMRIERQSSSAEKIVAHLHENRQSYKALKEIYHSSLQSEAFVKQQLSSHSPVFAIDLVSEEAAKRFPSKCSFFQHATSLGGVESLVEWRAMSDTTVRPTLLRLSVGTENVQDLIEDLDTALKSCID